MNFPNAAVASTRLQVLRAPQARQAAGPWPFIGVALAVFLVALLLGLQRGSAAAQTQAAQAVSQRPASVEATPPQAF